MTSTPTPMSNLLSKVISRRGSPNSKKNHDLRQNMFTPSTWVKEAFSATPIPGGHNQCRATTSLEYHVDSFNGICYASYLVTYHPDSAPEPNESGWFDGHETFVGSVEGNEGTFVLRSSGKILKGKVTGEWTVLEGTGKDGLVGIRGGGWYEYKLSGEKSYGKGKGGMKFDFDEDKTAL